MRYLVAMFVPGITFLAYLEVQPYGVTYDETRLLVSVWVSSLAARLKMAPASNAAYISE